MSSYSVIKILLCNSKWRFMDLIFNNTHFYQQQNDIDSSDNVANNTSVTVTV